MANKGIKERFRKFIVSLKRNPSRIPLVAFVLTFVYYSFNLSSISNTTAKINLSGMGICGFMTMLFSMLSLVALMNSFPHRKPVNKPMLIVTLVLVGLVIFADFKYRSLIYWGVNAANPNHITVDMNTLYIKKAADMLSLHIVFMFISTGLVVTLPFYSTLIKKINTNVEIESYGKMEAIELEKE